MLMNYTTKKKIFLKYTYYQQTVKIMRTLHVCRTIFHNFRSKKHIDLSMKNTISATKKHR